ncbi:Hypothetical protein BAMTRB_007 [Escherichia phage vB_Eco_Bam]|uniref:Uncharacterized protein n=1 Tax=Escherichia phage vB_Eco_Bam TaxID=2898833 RepID=A0A9P0VD20_9CAUD|nr:Hypothetical protein BAMTRB_007 [Escherichia phage vB_Eco_Bam]
MTAGVAWLGMKRRKCNDCSRYVLGCRRSEYCSLCVISLIITHYWRTSCLFPIVHCLVHPVGLLTRRTPLQILWRSLL